MRFDATDRQSRHDEFYEPTVEERLCWRANSSLVFLAYAGPGPDSVVRGNDGGVLALSSFEL